MKTGLLRNAALTLGLCSCGLAQAQYGNGLPPYHPVSPYGNGFATNAAPAQAGPPQFVGLSQLAATVDGAVPGVPSVPPVNAYAPQPSGYALFGGTYPGQPNGSAYPVQQNGYPAQGSQYVAPGSGYAGVTQVPRTSPQVNPWQRDGWGGAPYQPVPSPQQPSVQVPQYSFRTTASPAPIGFGQQPYRAVSSAQQSVGPVREQIPAPANGVYEGGSGMALYPSESGTMHGGMQAGAIHEGAIHQGTHHQGPVGHGLVSQGQADCEDCNDSSVYLNAASTPCGPELVGPSLSPVRKYFIGTNLLFLDFEQNFDQHLVFRDAMPSDVMLRTGQVDPGSSTGFETFFGRYFGCGKYAVMGSYFFLNPESETALAIPGMAGDYRTDMPHWDRLYIDQNGDMVADDWGTVGDATDDHLYTVYDVGSAYRVRRDVEFQGLEVNFVSFGIGGAARMGIGNCDPCAPCGSGCGGLCGPLVPGCNSRLQFQFSHGLRWFQFRDEFEFATSINDWVYGHGTDDFYQNVETENNLIGYQFGSRIAYCVMPRVMVYAGGKFGIYGNRVDYEYRLGTRGTTAQVGNYYTAYQNQHMDIRRDDTVLSTLGEIDLGAGYRISKCWTLTGGYRLMSITGVATSVGSIPADPGNVWRGHLKAIDDSILLHGGYVGLQYNW